MKTVIAVALGVVLGVCIVVVGFLSLFAPGASRSRKVIKEAMSDAPEASVLHALTLNYDWRKEGFGNVLSADFTITNPTEKSVKDLTISCVHRGASGTVIDSNTRTIYDFVPAKSTRRFAHFNMGFMHGQAVNSGCEITDVKLATETEETVLRAEAAREREREKVTAEATAAAKIRAVKQAELDRQRQRESAAEFKKMQAQSDAQRAKLVSECRAKYGGKQQWEMPIECQRVIEQMRQP